MGQLQTSSFWFQHIGPEYVAMAFQFARHADPGATLYYNDFESEGAGTKSDGVFNLVSELVRRQGVPIGGVDWQTHKVNPFRISAANRSNAQRLVTLASSSRSSVPPWSSLCVDLPKRSLGCSSGWRSAASLRC